MFDLGEWAKESIRNLAIRMEAGEITEEECDRWSIEIAKLIGSEGERRPIVGDPIGSAEPAGADDPGETLGIASAVVRFSEWAEENPRAVQAAVAGLIHALGHYARSGMTGE